MDAKGKLWDHLFLIVLTRVSPVFVVVPTVVVVVVVQMAIVVVDDIVQYPSLNIFCGSFTVSYTNWINKFSTTTYRALLLIKNISHKKARQINRLFSSKKDTHTHIDRYQHHRKHSNFLYYEFFGHWPNIQ